MERSIDVSGELQDDVATFTNTGANAEDVWLVFPNVDALHALNDLGGYGEVHIKANANMFTSTKSRSGRRVPNARALRARSELIVSWQASGARDGNRTRIASLEGHAPKILKGFLTISNRAGRCLPTTPQVIGYESKACYQSRDGDSFVG